MNKTPKVFVSYSWDNEEQKDWVAGFVSRLRTNGVDATFDVYETQRGTTNLNKMMVKGIRESDYTIIILTNNYVNKANNMQGGVGYETSMLLSLIQNSLKKIIPIMTKWNTCEEVPFYLSGVHYIDFSKNDGFEELLHRIFNVDIIEQVPIGTKPNLTTRKIEMDNKNDFSAFIPELREVTDLDKNNFMKESYMSIKEGLLSLLEATKIKNRNFDFELEDITTRKCFCSIYKNGNQVHSFKMWLGAFGAITNTINIAYGNQYSDSDSSANEIISCEVSEDNKLILKMMMNVWRNNSANNPELITLEIWEHILVYIK